MRLATLLALIAGAFLLTSATPEPACEQRPTVRLASVLSSHALVGEVRRLREAREAERAAIAVSSPTAAA